MDQTLRPLLFFDAKLPKSTEPLIDDLTKKMTAALRHQQTGSWTQEFNFGGRWHGTYVCVCGASSTDVDYLLPGGFVTNSLCIHYLAWHRNEVPKTYLESVDSFPDDFDEPTSEQLQ